LSDNGNRYKIKGEAKIDDKIYPLANIIYSLLAFGPAGYYSLSSCLASIPAF
jgi:hypothetical protein